MSAQSNAKMCRELYELFNKKDLDGTVAMASEDVEVDLIPFGQTFRGPAGLREFEQGFATAFPDLTITVTNQVATEDQVVNECTWTGTHTGPLQTPTGTIPPTGKKVEGGRFCEVYAFKNNKIVSVRNYQDPAGWLRQLGLVP